MQAEFCDVCGDIGCAETIITYAKCKINQEHFYCMETFRMEAPEVWLCEECTPRNGNQSSCGKSGVTVAPNFTTSFSDKTVQPPAKRHIEKQQPPKAFNPIAEVKMTEKFVEKKRNDIFSSVESHSCKNIISGPMEKENIGDAKITHTIAEETTDKHTSVASACCPQVISECGTSNVNLMTFSTNNKKCFSDPAQHPSWKGSFNVCDNLNFKGFQAHHPLRVHWKACEFSKLLPEILDFKLVPRENLWGKLFHDYCPTREDVGLYFFPSDKDRSKEYVILMELIRDQDLMMRKQIDNVEILVLTSTVLQMDCQKMEGNYFLWGLFHRIGKKDKVANIEFVDKEIDISGKDNEEVVALEIDMTGGGQSVGKADSIKNGDNEEVDMEIDMIGGQNVGKQDVVIRRNSSGNRYESSTPTPVTASLTSPISNTTDSGMMQCGLSKVKREEPFEDVPPGFKPLPLRNKSECSTPTAGVTVSSIMKVKREAFGDVRVPPGFKPLLPP
nr:uncharacterized protein LOC109193588 isoform X1 [Ipomoea batatas]